MMNIKIYQINRTRDEDRIKFLGMESLPAVQGNQDINSKIYDKVYQGSVEAASLEDVYRMFNTEHPRDFRGHSLSVSDVVEVVEGPEMTPGFYFCDCVGFQRVEFHPELTAELGKTLQVVLLEPGKMARAVEIDGSLQGLQKVVGGYCSHSSFYFCRCAQPECGAQFFEELCSCLSGRSHHCAGMHYFLRIRCITAGGQSRC